MPDSGRNDPCPCGSGRKYKKCCLAGPSVVPFADDDGAREGALDRLLRFAARPQFDQDRQIAIVLFWADYLDELTEEAEYELLHDIDTETKFNPFFVFDLEIDKGQTIVDMFLARMAHEVSRSERAFLERMAASCLALYEVTHVDPGEGVSLRDLMTREERFVSERVGTESMATWDVLGARVVPDSTGTLRFEGGVYLYPSMERDRIVRKFKRLWRQYAKRNPGADLASFLRRHSMVFNHVWMDLVVLPGQAHPRLQTTDGEELLFSAVQFDVLDEPAATRALDGRTDLERNGDGSCAWLEPRADGVLLLGTLYADRLRWRLETMSRARAERGRAWIESWAGNAVRHRGTTHQAPASLLSSAPPVSARPAAGVPPDVEARVMQEAMDRHYRDWLDQPIPMFAGRTPREAARSRRLKPRVIDFLKTLENDSERNRRAGRHAYDPRWLWDALALRHPLG